MGTFTDGVRLPRARPTFGQPKRPDDGGTGPPRGERARSTRPGRRLQSRSSRPGRLLQSRGRGIIPLRLVRISRGLGLPCLTDCVRLRRLENPRFSWKSRNKIRPGGELLSDRKRTMVMLRWNISVRSVEECLSLRRWGLSAVLVRKPRPSSVLGCGLHLVRQGQTEVRLAIDRRWRRQVWRAEPPSRCASLVYRVPLFPSVRRNVQDLQIGPIVMSLAAASRAIKGLVNKIEIARIPRSSFPNFQVAK